MKHEIEHIHQDIFNNIKQLMDQARNRVSREVNNILIQTYWEIGRIIVEDEQGNLERAEYGKKLITDLSKYKCYYKNAHFREFKNVQN